MSNCSNQKRNKSEERKIGGRLWRKIKVVGKDSSPPQNQQSNCRFETSIQLDLILKSAPGSNEEMAQQPQIPNLHENGANLQSYARWQIPVDSDFIEMAQSTYIKDSKNGTCFNIRSRPLKEELRAKIQALMKDVKQYKFNLEIIKDHFADCFEKVWKDIELMMADQMSQLVKQVRKNSNQMMGSNEAELRDKIKNLKSLLKQKENDLGQMTYALKTSEYEKTRLKLVIESLKEQLSEGKKERIKNTRSFEQILAQDEESKYRMFSSDPINYSSDPINYSSDPINRENRGHLEKMAHSDGEKAKQDPSIQKIKNRIEDLRRKLNKTSRKS